MSDNKKAFIIYQGLPEQLAIHYKELPFDDHCYLRMALDNTFSAQWDTKIPKPAYKNLNQPHKKQVLQFLNHSKKDHALILHHLLKSLKYRKECKETQLNLSLKLVK